MALFISFEGGEGSGKSTQAAILYDRLKKERYKVTSVEEPGTTLLGKMLRQWLSNKDTSLTLIPAEQTQLSLLEKPIDDQLIPGILLHNTAPHAELLAFVIARAQLVDEIIIPHLTNNNIVISNRYSDSTMAYQGYGRGLDLKLIKMANKIATRGIKPDLTILLDISPEDGLARKMGGNPHDHFEQQVLEFYKKIRDGYLTMAKAEPKRWLVIDAAKKKGEIAEIIFQRTEQELAKRGMKHG